MVLDAINTWQSNLSPAAAAAVGGGSGTPTAAAAAAAGGGGGNGSSRPSAGQQQQQQPWEVHVTPNNTAGAAAAAAPSATARPAAVAEAAKAAEMKIKQHSLHGSKTSGTDSPRSKAAERKMTGLTTEDEEALIRQMKGWRLGLNPKTDAAKVSHGVGDWGAVPCGLGLRVWVF